MRKIISFSIWGTDKMYLDGALENLLIASKIYPEWTCRFYLRNDVPYEVEDILYTNGAEIVRIEPPYKGEWEGLYWRFYPAADSSIERFISRDIDSILNVREAAAVNEWIESGKPFHIMRDHEFHSMPILGGMWGCIGGEVPDMVELIRKYGDFSKKGADQIFLEKTIWKQAYFNNITHGEYYKDKFNYNNCIKPFPKHEELPKDSPYVGSIVEHIRQGLEV